MERHGFTPERWAGLRALREGKGPVFTRLALVAGLHPDTIRKRALREGWKGLAEAAAGDEPALPA